MTIFINKIFIYFKLLRYVKDHLSGHWYKFNDHRVKKCKTDIESIIEEGVGVGVRSAYFLVYIREETVLPKKRTKVIEIYF